MKHFITDETTQLRQVRSRLEQARRKREDLACESTAHTALLDAMEAWLNQIEPEYSRSQAERCARLIAIDRQIAELEEALSLMRPVLITV